MFARRRAYEVGSRAYRRRPGRVPRRDPRAVVRPVGRSAWVGSDATPTIRVAGADLAIEDSIDVPTGLPFLFEGGLMWGAGPTELWAIDPATNDVARHIALEDVIEILGLDIEGDEAWLAVRKTGRIGWVLRMDLEDGGVVDEFSVSLPAAVRIGPERAWVASYLTNELLGFER